MQQEGLNATERRAAASIASLYALRMLGLFMILPVFSHFAKNELHGYTPALLGLAIGIYGFTQALMQIPMGLLSDRIGRKRVIVVGFLIFIVGSVVAAAADDIYTVIAGRALQGAGAVAAVLMALAADLTREQNRSRVMGVIGACIGLSFAISMVSGPFLFKWIGVPGIFLLTAFLSALAIVSVKFWVPDPKKSIFHRDAEPDIHDFKSVFTDMQLQRVNVGIFTLHFVLMSLFVVFPFVLTERGDMPVATHWKVYLPVIVLALVIMFPIVAVAEIKHKLKTVFLLCIKLLVLSVVGFAFTQHVFWGFMAFFLLFFVAFNVLEAILPSLVVKMVSADKKGTAMGAYTSMQFIGTFLGGWMGGVVYGLYEFNGVFYMGGIMLTAWLVFAWSMKEPKYLTSYLLYVGPLTGEQATELTEKINKVTGVAEAKVVLDEGVAYLKIDKKKLDWNALDQFAVREA